MSIWRVDPTDVEPSTALVRFQVMRAENTGEQHLVGWAQDVREGRVSSPVVAWDPVKRLAVTRSGRVYELVGPPGLDDDALYVWQRWLKIHGSPGWADVTAEFMAQSPLARQRNAPPCAKGTQGARRQRTRQAAR